MENNKIETIEKEKQTPFLKRVAKMEKEIVEISRQLDTIKKSIRNLGR